MTDEDDDGTLTTMSFTDKELERIFAIMGIAAHHEDDKAAITGIATTLFMLGSRMVGSEDPLLLAKHPLGKTVGRVAAMCLGKAVQVGAVTEEEMEDMAKEAANEVLRDSAKAGWNA